MTSGIQTLERPHAKGLMHFAYSNYLREGDKNLRAEVDRYFLEFSGTKNQRFFRESEFRNGVRSLEWAESRRCLVALLALLPRQKLNSVSLSLSHTKEGCVAALFEPTAESRLLGIGVDLESARREIPNRMMEKFVLPGERELGLTQLQLWMIKEAAFKAHSDSVPRVVSNYQIDDFHDGLGTGSMFEGWKFDFGIFPHGEHLVSWALG